MNKKDVLKKLYMLKKEIILNELNKQLDIQTEERFTNYIEGKPKIKTLFKKA